MKKHVLVSVSFLSLTLLWPLLSSHSAKAQTWQWANSMGSSYQPPTVFYGRNEYAPDQSIQGMGLDNSGNIYVGGSANRYPQFGSVSITQPALGNQEGYLGFIAKYSCEGNLKWVKTMLSNWGDDNVSGFVVDHAGNSYVTGRVYSDSTYFGGTLYTELTGSFGWFLAKYDSNGTFKWVKFTDTIPGGLGSHVSALNEQGETIGINSAGVIIVAGYYGTGIGVYADSMIFPGIHLHSNSTGMVHFLAGFDAATGSALWAKNVDEIAPGTNWGGTASFSSMVIDNNDNIYFSGSFSDTAQIGTQVLYAPHLLNHSVIAKFDPTGNFIWAKQAWCASAWDGFGSMAYSKSDNSLYLYANAANTDTIFDYPVHVTGGSALQTNIILKLDTGANLIWGINQDSLSALWSTSEQFTTDNAGNVYYTSGWFSGGKLKWGTYPSTSHGGNNYSYLMKLNSTGVVQYILTPNIAALVVPPAISDDQGEAIAVNSHGDIFLAGAFSGYMYIGSDTIQNPASGVDNNMYLIKYGDNLCPTGALATAKQMNEPDKVTIFPNPSDGKFTLSWHLTFSKSELIITDITGSTVYTETLPDFVGMHEIDIAHLSSGIYFYRVFSENTIAIYGKILVVK